MIRIQLRLLHDPKNPAKIDKKNREKQGFALHDSNNFLVFEKAGRRPRDHSVRNDPGISQQAQIQSTELSFVKRNEVSERIPGVQLTRTSDGFSIEPHFSPLCDPSGEPSDGKHYRKHMYREAQCPVDDP